MRRIWIVVSIISLVLLADSGAALADSCSAIRSQMRVKADVSNSQVAQIRRQIAAIRAIERKRSCTAEKASAGGFFNACRSSARQRQDAERELAAAQGGGGASLRKRYKALGCETHPDRQERLIKPDAAKRSGPKYAGSTLFYCVRPSDGYFFPAPKSQFARKNYPEIAVDQCRFICEDPAMALYALEDPELETGEMISVETKTPYRELPTAFRYQAKEFEACNWSRYFARVKELRARTVTLGNLANAIVPAPTFRPEQQDTLFTSAYKAEADVESVHRKVRVVGPTFLSDERSEFREISNRAKERGSLTHTMETLIKLRYCRVWLTSTICPRTRHRRRNRNANEPLGDMDIGLCDRERGMYVVLMLVGFSNARDVMYFEKHPEEHRKVLEDCRAGRGWFPECEAAEAIAPPAR